MPFNDLPDDTQLDSSPAPGGFSELPVDTELDKPQPKGFGQRLSQDINNRGAQYQDILKDVGTGATSYPEAAARVAGNIGGMLVNDPMKEAGTSIWNHTPDFITKPVEGAISKGISSFNNTDIGKMANQDILSAQSYLQQNPRLAKDLGAAGDIAGAVTPFIPVSKAIPSAVDMGMDAAGATASGAISAGKGALNMPGKIASKVIPAAMPDIESGTADLAAKAMDKYNIPLAGHQITDSPSMDTIQKISDQIPFSGTSNFYKQQSLAVNKAVAKSFGADAAKITPEVIQKGYDGLGEQFQKLFHGRDITFSPAQLNGIQSVMEDAKSQIGTGAQGILQKNLDTLTNDIESGTMTGEKANQIRIKTQEAMRGMKDADGRAAQPFVADALNKFVDAGLAEAPGTREDFTKLKYQYKNLLAVTPVAGKAVRGDINPSLLEGAVQRVYGAKAYATGNAGELGDIAKIGKTFLTKLGGSDTAQKGALLEAATHPVGAVMSSPLIPAARAYQKGNFNQDAMRKFISKYESAPSDTALGFAMKKATGQSKGGKIGFKKKPK